MQLPPEVDENFHADKMHALPFKATGTKVFDYRVKKDSIIYSGYGDTTVTFGIIFPRARVTGIKTTQLRVVGNDSLLCNIQYNTHDIYLLSESHSLLGDIILPPEKYKRDMGEESSSITYYYRYFRGLCTYGLQDTAFFSYEEIKPKDDLDTSVITGKIYDRYDSLILKPYYLAVTQNSKKKKFIYMLEGLGFYQEGQLLAFLQYAPLIEPGHEKLHIRSGISPGKQMLIAAYFTLFFDRH